jgi:hypothetical protein
LRSPVRAHGFAQPKAIGKQDGNGITMAPTVLPGRVHQPVDLGLFQVLARALLCHCYIYRCWSVEIDLLIFHDFPPSMEADGGPSLTDK